MRYEDLDKLEVGMMVSVSAKDGLFTEHPIGIIAKLQPNKSYQVVVDFKIKGVPFKITEIDKILSKEEYPEYHL